MQDQQTNLLMRDDTFFGVCEALGEDFGFNPQYLRIAFAVPVIWNPVAVFVAYGVAGLVVLTSRLFFPTPRQAAASEDSSPAGDTAAPLERLPLAA